MNLAILYSESKFTQWKENIDAETVFFVFKALKKANKVSVVHATDLNSDLAELLSSFDVVVNLCNGYKQHQQHEVAMWLDSNGIHQIANSGKSQRLAQDKWLAERIMNESGLPVVRSISTPDVRMLTPYVIAKPRFGGCHRGIEVVPSEEIPYHWKRWQEQDQLVQPYLTGREFSVAVLPKARGIHFQALDPVEIVPVPHRELFLAGQSMGKTVREFSPVMSEPVSKALKEVAIRAHCRMGFDYASRVDFRVWNDQVFILDVNSMPNMHPRLSLFPALLRHNRIRMSEFYRRMLKAHREVRNSTQVQSLAM